MCPAGTPIGWGTVTPDVLWSAACSQCLLTLTPQKTATPYPLPTWAVGLTQTAAYATGTETLVATRTITPSPIPVSDITLVSFTTTKHFNTGGSGSSDWACSLSGGVVRCDGTFTISDSSSLFSSQYDSTVVVGDPSTPRDYYLTYQNDAIQVGNGSGRSNQSGSWVSIPVGTSQSGQAQALNQSGNWTVTKSFDTSTNTYTGTWIWRKRYTISTSGYVPIADPTATPTVTPTPVVSDCSTVSGSTAVDITDLPGILIGPAICTGFDGAEIDLSTINWLTGMSFEDISLPGVEVCFRPITFGKVKIFGMEFDLDILSAVITGVLAIRWLFRS